LCVMLGAFPTPVGMNRLKATSDNDVLCVPHTCGDEPALLLLLVTMYMRSPHLWG